MTLQKSPKKSNPPDIARTSLAPSYAFEKLIVTSFSFVTHA